MKFSILNLLMILTAIAALVGLYSSRQANIEVAARYDAVIAGINADKSKLEIENKKLRQAAGALTITDPKKIHAIKLESVQPKTWSYRVHLPEGRQYYFACQLNSLPLTSEPPLVENPPGPSTIGSLVKNSVGIGSPAGEYIVKLSVNLVENKWRYRLAVRKAGQAGEGAVGGSAINDADGKWPAVEDAIGSGGVVNQTVISLDNSPLLLLDLRAMNGNVTSSRDSIEGAMLWVGTSN